jgi:hypothetical protein
MIKRDKTQFTPLETHTGTAYNEESMAKPPYGLSSGISEDDKKFLTGFKVGEAVQKAGIYICVPCGYKKKYKAGERFARCLSCMRGKQYEGDDFFHDLELWEPVEV